MKTAFALVILASIICQFDWTSAGGPEYSPSPSLPLSSSPSPSIESPSPSPSPLLSPSPSPSPSSSPSQSPSPSKAVAPPDVICKMAADGMVLNGLFGDFGQRVCDGDKFTVDGWKCPSRTFYITSEPQCCCFPSTYTGENIYFPGENASEGN